MGKLIEPLWGSIEMMKFFLLVNTGVAITAAIFYYFLYMLTFNTELLFEVHIHGLAGYLAGVSVAVKQVMPDHIIYRSPMGKITNRNIPLACVVLSFVMWAVGLVEGSYCTMYTSGLVISWIYLRFYQLHANGNRGDNSDSFAFASFFPNVLQPPINACFGLLVKLQLCKKPVRRYDMQGGSSSGGPAISISLPGVENHDTERRRQIALKALKDRLSKNEQSSGSEATKWPSLEDETEQPPPQKSTEKELAAATTAIDIEIDHPQESDKQPLLES